MPSLKEIDTEGQKKEICEVQVSSNYGDVSNSILATLGLWVVDQGMGYEVRTTYSLSARESFIPSLALALSFASLSSSQMKVECLFLDEGFIF